MRPARGFKNGRAETAMKLGLAQKVGVTASAFPLVRFNKAIKDTVIRAVRQPHRPDNTLIVRTGKNLKFLIPYLCICAVHIWLGAFRLSAYRRSTVRPRRSNEGMTSLTAASNGARSMAKCTDKGGQANRCWMMRYLVVAFAVDC